MNNQTTNVIFLGTGTSQGVPVIGCNCKVCTSQNPLDKRLRASIFISYNNTNIVIDAGPDFRQQMLANNIDNIDAVLQTHEHKDHLCGLDDIRPINFKYNKSIDIIGEERIIEVVKKDFSYVFKENKYPGLPVMNLQTITSEPFIYKDIPITPIRIMHWNLPILGYRIKNFAYITDCSEISEAEQTKLFGLDVLVINALRHKKHYSHFNLEESLALIEVLKPKKAYLTHVSHYMGLYEEESLHLPKNVYFAYDGLTIHI